MRYVRSRLGIMLAVAVAIVLATGAVSLPWPFYENVASAQSEDPTPTPGPDPDAPRITSLTNITASSITVNWQAADDTDVHWIYSVKADGSDGRFRQADSEPPLSTTITGLDDGTTYWFAVLGSKSPSESNPNEWFSWSTWARSTTLEIGRVSLGSDVSVAEGGTANLTVISTTALASPLTVSYAIGTDDDDATVDADSDDYTGSAAGSVTIEAGATEATIPVVISDDSDIDDGARETLEVTITIPDTPGYRLGDRASATVTINEGVCDRTAEVRTIILSKFDDISDCAQVTDPDLRGITRNLLLPGQRITELKARDFRGLTGLQRLRLNNNSLESLPEDAFEGLTSLEQLSLYNNSLGSLPADVFDGLTALEVLWLDNNSLESLPEDVFDGLAALQELSLDNNSLESLPEDVFDGLTGLEVLWLDNNSLESLPEDVFDSLTALYELFLESNPGSPFTFTAEIEQTVVNQVKVSVSDAVPIDLTATLSVTGGTLSTSSVEIPAGSSESSTITVTPDGDDPVTVSVTAASFPASGSTVDGVSYNYNGIQTGVGAANQAPTADAGSDQTVGTEDEVTLDASGSIDADTSDTLSYSWTQTAGTTVTLSSTTASGPTFTAPTTEGDLTFQVIVTDGRGGSDRDSVTVTVDDFTPQDLTYSTPGTYTLNIGQADRIYISGRGADGGDGGGGGGGGGGISYHNVDNSTGAVGQGGTGNSGPDGMDGQGGDSPSITNVRGGSGGGGGEAGESPSDSTVHIGAAEKFKAESGVGGAGGDGGKGGSGQERYFRNSVAGGVGGDGGDGSTASQLSSGGGAGGANNNLIFDVGGRVGQNGYSGTAGTEVDERLFTDIPGNTVLIIVVPSAGTGGAGGGGANGAYISSSAQHPNAGATAGDGSAGVGGSAGTSNGWIRIRTATIDSLAPSLAPQNLSSETVAETRITLRWDEASNTSKYRVEYRLATAEDWTTDDDTLTSTLHTVDGLTCGTEYQFRVSAYGNGTFYAVEWGDPSEALSGTTAACSN